MIGSGEDISFIGQDDTNPNWRTFNNTSMDDVGGLENYTNNSSQEDPYTLQYGIPKSTIRNSKLNIHNPQFSSYPLQTPLVDLTSGLRPLVGTVEDRSNQPQKNYKNFQIKYGLHLSGILQKKKHLEL